MIQTILMVLVAFNLLTTISLRTERDCLKEKLEATLSAKTDESENQEQIKDILKICSKKALR